MIRASASIPVVEPWAMELGGRFEETGPLGDPHLRPLWVYLPPGLAP